MRTNVGLCSKCLKQPDFFFFYVNMKSSLLLIFETREKNSPVETCYMTSCQDTGEGYSNCCNKTQATCVVSIMNYFS